MTNSPINVLNTGLNSLCWHQAIYPNISRDYVKKNDVIEAEITFRKDCILVESKLVNIILFEKKFLNKHIIFKFEYLE